MTHIHKGDFILCYPKSDGALSSVFTVFTEVFSQSYFLTDVCRNFAATAIASLLKYVIMFIMSIHQEIRKGRICHVHDHEQLASVGLSYLPYNLNLHLVSGFLFIIRFIN